MKSSKIGPILCPMGPMSVPDGLEDCDLHEDAIPAARDYDPKPAPDPTSCANKLPRQNGLRGLRQNGRRNEVDEASVDVSILQVS